MRRGRTITAVVAIALSGCSARLIPQGPSAPAGPSRVSPEKPLASKPLAKPAPVIAPKPVEAVVPKGPNAAMAGVLAGPRYESFGVSDESATRALAAFRISCGSLQRRTDGSGLTKGSDWTSACVEAATARDAQAFFSNNFDVVQVGDGKSLATGYYEPEIAGARMQSPQYNVPVYKRPSDIIEVDLGLFSDDLKGKRVRGRVKGTNLIPYADRAEIEEGGLSGRGLELAWAADPVEFFFLQVQGSGRLRLPDGSVMRIGYDGQNGRDYTGIGKLMKDRGLLGPGQTSMQGIMAYLRANPEEGRAIMRENKSWIFFKELTGAGPLGALGLPVTPKGTVAADPMFVPLGAPVLLSTDRAEANGLWVAQDTGGAIKGSNRFDTFWGAGSEARTIAGGMSGRGSAFLLLPKGVLARLKAEAPVAGTPPQR